LIASVVFVEDDPISYSGVFSVFPPVVVFCYLLSIELVTPSGQTKSVTFPAILFADRLNASSILVLVLLMYGMPAAGSVPTAGSVD